MDISSQTEHWLLPFIHKSLQTQQYLPVIVVIRQFIIAYRAPDISGRLCKERLARDENTKSAGFDHAGHPIVQLLAGRLCHRERPTNILAGASVGDKK